MQYCYYSRRYFWNVFKQSGKEAHGLSGMSGDNNYCDIIERQDYKRRMP